MTFMYDAIDSKAPIHNANCSMQLVACNRIASCVLEKLWVTSGVKLFQANRTIIFNSSQHVACSFKELTGNATTSTYVSMVICTRVGEYRDNVRCTWQVCKCEYQNGCIFMDGGENRCLHYYCHNG